MIIEFTRDKKLKHKSIKYVQEYKQFFETHSKWIKGSLLRDIIGGGDVRRIINTLRVEYNMSIISSRDGYKLSNDKEEIKQCYADLRNRALRGLTAARMMKKNIK